MRSAAHLAIDLGAETGRVVLGRLAGDVLAVEELHRFPNRPLRRADGLRWDVELLWRGILEGIRFGASRAADRDASLRSIGVDTWGVDFTLLDADGEMLLDPFCYRDPRHGPAFAAAVDRLGADRIFAATGIQLMPLNTLYQLLALRAERPDLLSRASHLLFMPDFLHWRLTGARQVERTIASTSQMMLPGASAWAIELIEQADLPKSILGDVVDAGATVGPLRPDVIADTAAVDAEVILPAAHDTASAVAAAPACSDTPWCFLSSGTWSLLGAEVDQPIVTETARLASFTNEAGAAGTIHLLRNMTGLWLVQACRRVFDAIGESYDYASLTRLAAQAPPFRTLIDPALPDFAQPGDILRRIGDFATATGQKPPRSVGEFVRCCLDSLALAYRTTLHDLEDLTGTRYEIVHVLGGGGRNELLCQLTADVVNRPLVVGPHEATAIGNILIQALRPSDRGDLDRLRAVVRQSVTTRRYEPVAYEECGEAVDRFAELQWNSIR
jgi:rhamnulokinase